MSKLEIAERREAVMAIIGYNGAKDTATYMGVPICEYTYHELVRIIHFLARDKG